MLQILQKSTFIAIATVTCIGFGLNTPAALAQHHAGCKTCQAGAVCPTCQASQCRTGKCQQLNCRPRQDGQPELFYNYYIPGTCGGMPAAMYLAPRPVPPMVGYTYFTYQPALPHELLYQHSRSYHRYYDGGRGMTRTHISWYRPPVQSGVAGIANHLRLAR